MFDNPSLLSSAILCRRNEESESGDGIVCFPRCWNGVQTTGKKDPARIIRGCGQRKQLLLLTAAAEAERFRT